MADYLVTWSIDVEGESALEAAREALMVMRDDDPANTATVFTVLNKETGEKTTVNLTDEEEALWERIFETITELVKDGVSIQCAGRCGWEMAIKELGNDTETRERAALAVAEALDDDWTAGSGLGMCLAPNWRDHLKK